MEIKTLILLSLVTEFLFRSVASEAIVYFCKEDDSECTIPCPWKGTTVPPRYRWDVVSGSGDVLERGFVNEHVPTKGRYHIQLLNNETVILIITNPKRNDSKMVRCFVQETNKDAYFSVPLELIVHYLENPFINGTSYVYEGNFFVIKCLSDGNPAPTLTMYKGDQVLNTINENNTLVYRKDSADLNDAGDYICEAESDSYRGEYAKTSSTHNLEVSYLELEIEENAVSCFANNFPNEIQLILQKDGAEIGKGQNNLTKAFQEMPCGKTIICYSGDDYSTSKKLQNCPTKNYDPLVAAVVLLFVGVLACTCTLYCMYIKPVKMHDEITEVMEGESLVLKKKISPFVAMFDDLNLLYTSTEVKNVSVFSFTKRHCFKNDIEGVERGDEEMSLNSSSQNGENEPMEGSVNVQNSGNGVQFINGQQRVNLENGCMNRERQTTRRHISYSFGTLTVRITNLVMADGGKYKLTIKRKGKEYKGTTTLLVYKMESKQTAFKGEHFRLQCAVSDRGPTDLTWKKMADSSLYPADFQDNFITLRIKTVEGDHAGKYQLVNKDNTVIGTTDLIVEEAPFKVKDKKDTQVAYAGVNIASLELEFIDMVPTSENIKWMRNGRNILSQRYETYFEESTAMLLIKEPTHNDNGEYTVQVLWERRIFLYPVFLKVVDPLLCFGANTQICARKGVPVVMRFQLMKPQHFDGVYFWHNDQQVASVSSDSPSGMQDFRAKVEGSTFILKISKARENHVGTYQCIITTGSTICGKMVSHSLKVHLTIDSSDYSMKNVEAVEGQSAEFLCDCSSNMHMKSFQWFRVDGGHKQIQLSNSKGEKKKYDVIGYLNKSVFIIYEVTREDAGFYVCKGSENEKVMVELVVRNQ